MASTYTGRLWNWTKQVDQPAQVVTHAILFSCALVNPLALLAYGGLYAGTAVADGVAKAAAAAREAARKRAEEAARLAREAQLEREERARTEAARERARAAAEAAEVARIKALPEYRAAEARRVYEERLRMIAAAPLDETERRTAHEHAKQQLLKVLSEVMR